ncbi:uncharacterized protein LOC110268311 [Arachis ipaensis]|uniref:uncharacterized protein LOC110268311 n=1 Tax=Arachis ipaensis TaxID=130454 RepID=UPI000A2B2E83|nr:uncharacterized protein LOC110268311 [Arachis ipaensis]
MPLILIKNPNPQIQFHFHQHPTLTPFFLFSTLSPLLCRELLEPDPPPVAPPMVGTTAAPLHFSLVHLRGPSCHPRFVTLLVYPRRWVCVATVSELCVWSLLVLCQRSWYSLVNNGFHK